MLSKILKALLIKEPNEVPVIIERDGALIMVRLRIKGHRVARIQCVIESNTVILIGDIQHYNGAVDYNKGYGSLLMEKLLEYAKENNYEYVYGNLSEVDLDHKERLHHFYEKLGFTITEYPEQQGNYYGKIEMFL